MKAVLVSFFFLFTFLAHSQQSLSLEDDFKLDPTILDGLVLSTIPEELYNVGITQNPGVFDDKNVINYITNHIDIESDNILAAYIEVYDRKGSDMDYARVIVMHFDSKNTLEDILPTLSAQSNIVYLIKDNFLIQVWGNLFSGTEKQIADMVNYYRNKLQAEIYKAKDR